MTSSVNINYVYVFWCNSPPQLRTVFIVANRFCSSASNTSAFGINTIGMLTSALGLYYPDNRDFFCCPISGFCRLTGQKK